MVGDEDGVFELRGGVVVVGSITMTPDATGHDPTGSADAFDDDRLRTAVTVGLGRPRTVERLGAGGDHHAWVVDVGGDEWVVRTPLERSSTTTSATTLCELVDHLRRVLPAALASWVPEHRLVGSGGWVAHRLVRGRPLQDLLGTDSAVLVVGDLSLVGRQLGELVAAVERVSAPPGVPVDEVDPAGWLAEIDSMAGALEDLIGTERRSIVRSLVPEPFPIPGREQLALCHNDLGVEHVIVDDLTGAVSGVIDWSDAAVSDPAADVGRILRDLGGDAASAALAAMPESCRAGRARWYARVLIVEDLDFAARERPDLLARMLADFDRLYARFTPPSPSGSGAG